MMSSLQLAGLIGVAEIFIALAMISIERERRRRLGVLWSRACMGSEWRKHFSDASKRAIREFLDCFLDAFAFSSKQRFKFSPSDKVMDIYRAMYPSEGGIDSMELETFAVNLERKYGFDLYKIEDHAITLGTLFEMTKNPNNPVKDI